MIFVLHISPSRAHCKSDDGSPSLVHSELMVLTSFTGNHHWAIQNENVGNGTATTPVPATAEITNISTVPPVAVQSVSYNPLSTGLKFP